MTHEILEANTIALWSKFTTFPEVNDFSVLNRADKLKRSCTKFTQDLKKKKTDHADECRRRWAND